MPKSSEQSNQKATAKELVDQLVAQAERSYAAELESSASTEHRNLRKTKQDELDKLRSRLNNALNDFKETKNLLKDGETEPS